MILIVILDLLVVVLIPSTDTIRITADRSHSLKVGDFVNLNNIPSSNNTASRDKFDSMEVFEVDTVVVDEHTFTVKDVDIFGIARDPGDPIIFNSNKR